MPPHVNIALRTVFAIQSFDPQTQIFNWPIFGKVLYFPQKLLEGYTKLKQKDKTLNLVVNDHK